MFMYRFVSCVAERGCLLWQCVILATVTFTPDSLCTPSPNLPVTPSISWLPTFAFQSPMMKGHLLLILILKDHHRTIWLQLLQLSHWGLDLDYCDGEWFALEMNWDSTKPICYTLDRIVHQHDSLISSPHTVFGFMNQLKNSNTLFQVNDYCLSKREKKMARVEWATFLPKVGAYFHQNVGSLFSLIF